MNDDDEYRVGPGRPPREYQFKKKQSGNPGGKRKGTLNLRTLLMRELMAEVAVKNGGRITVIDAILRRLVRDAAEGKHRARESLLKRLDRYGTDAPEHHEEELQEDDEAILRRLGFSDPAADDQDGDDGHE